MRGKATRMRTGTRNSRITPAYAGKRLVLDIGIIIRIGSPPPMRGKGFGITSWDCIRGITPAYAGKSFGSRCSCRFEWDHPRLCGEKVSGMRRSCKNSGSPPPMRGKADVELNPLQDMRITPAYAGKSWIPITQFLNIQDHPRLCGEKLHINVMRKPLPGSPPPMRGKVR